MPNFDGASFWKVLCAVELFGLPASIQGEPGNDNVCLSSLSSATCFEIACLPTG